ncbi:MAG: hypothetical protein KGL39_59050 [Patescibacteria group bacterium]|nr:hypothetical protein [Patescibacteria group bacterium]
MSRPKRPMKDGMWVLIRAKAIPEPYSGKWRRRRDGRPYAIWIRVA